MSIRISGALWLCLGLLVYLWLGDYTVFSWSDPWLYIYMVLWPFPLLFNFVIWAIIIALIIGAIFIVIMFIDHQKTKRMRAKRHARFKNNP